MCVCLLVQVLMGFLGEGMTQSMLPLMINFEAKSITAQFPQLRETMEKRYDPMHVVEGGVSESFIQAERSARGVSG